MNEYVRFIDPIDLYGVELITVFILIVAHAPVSTHP